MGAGREVPRIKTSSLAKKRWIKQDKYPLVKIK